MKRHTIPLAVFLFLLLSALILRFVDAPHEAHSAVPVVEAVSNQEMVDLVMPDKDGILRKNVEPPIEAVESESDPKVRVSTISGEGVSGHLLLSKGKGAFASFVLTKGASSAIASEFSWDNLLSLQPSDFLVIPEGGGFVRGVEVAIGESDSTESELVVTILDPTSVEVLITDHNNQPIEGARVVPYEKLPFAGMEALTSVLTSAGGTAEIQEFYGSKGFLLRIYSEGYAMKTLRVEPGQGLVSTKLDRVFGLGIVMDRRKPFSYSIDGGRMDINFGGYRNEDWVPLAAKYEAALELGESEYIDWMINSERGAWIEAEENFFSPRTPNGTPFVMSVWNRAFVDPEFAVYHFPEVEAMSLEVHEPQRVKFGPESQFMAGYPDQIIFAVSGANGHEYVDPYLSLFSNSERTVHTQIAYHEGGGHYLVWLPPGEYEIVQPNGYDHRKANPQFLPGQVVQLEDGRQEAEILLAPDEAYVGIQVVDEAGFPVDCRWLLFPADAGQTSMLSKTRGRVAFRFVRPGRWDLRGTNGETLSLKTFLLAESNLWPASVNDAGVWSIPIQESTAFGGSYTFY